MSDFEWFVLIVVGIILFIPLSYVLQTGAIWVIALPLLFLAVAVGIVLLLFLYFGVSLWVSILCGVGFLIFVEMCCRVIVKSIRKYNKRDEGY